MRRKCVEMNAFRRVGTIELCSVVFVLAVKSKKDDEPKNKDEDDEDSESADDDSNIGVVESLVGLMLPNAVERRRGEFWNTWRRVYSCSVEKFKLLIDYYK